MEGGVLGALGVGDSKYHNPDPLCRLIGPKNKVEVIVNDERVTVLVDLGAQISAEFGGMDIPYIGYTQIQLQILDIKDYDKDILVFIQKDSHYSEQVLVILGTLHIKDVIQSATREELVKLGDAWEVGTLGSFVLARIAQLENAPMINQIDHYIRLTWKVMLPPMQVHKTVGVAKIPILSKRLNVMTELLLAQEAIEGVETVSSYKTFKQGETESLSDFKI